MIRRIRVYSGSKYVLAARFNFANCNQMKNTPSGFLINRENQMECPSFVYSLWNTDSSSIWNAHTFWHYSIFISGHVLGVPIHIYISMYEFTQTNVYIIRICYMLCRQLICFTHLLMLCVGFNVTCHTTCVYVTHAN